MTRMKRIRIIARGRVQGVGYRMFVRDAAVRYRVGGWVRNLDDGTVEAVLEGESGDVDTALEAIHARGSSIIRVDAISVIPEPPVGENGFSIRR